MSLQGIGIFCAWLTLAAAAPAATITAVTAPNLTRPKDGVLYPFDMTVLGTYHGVEIGIGLGISLPAEYWDADVFFDDPIDLHAAHTPGALNIPAPIGTEVAGVTPWVGGAITLTFQVGCTVPGEVFGPSGGTGENPMNDGYFFFNGAVAPKWGYNTVACVAVPTVPPPTWNPPSPYPGLNTVPEPSTMTMAWLALAALGILRRPSRRSGR